MLGVTVLRQDGYVRVQDRCSEIGEAGVGVVIPQDLVTLNPAETVILDFSLAGSSRCSIRTRAVVRHRSDSRYGFEFIGAGPGHRESILTFCRSLQEQTASQLLFSRCTGKIN